MEEIPTDPASHALPEDPPHYLCPNCGGAVDPPASTSPFLECLQCKTQFFPPVSESAANDDANSADADEEEADQESELSETRIRQLSRLYRSTYRTRSILIIFTLAFLGVGLYAFWFAGKAIVILRRIPPTQIAQICFGIAALIGAEKFGKRTRDLQREIDENLRRRRAEELEAAKHEPDLSTLSDGSHHIRNLERMMQTPEPGNAPETPGTSDAGAAESNEHQPPLP